MLDNVSRKFKPKLEDLSFNFSAEKGTRALLFNLMAEWEWCCFHKVRPVHLKPSIPLPCQTKTTDAHYLPHTLHEFVLYSFQFKRSSASTEGCPYYSSAQINDELKSPLITILTVRFLKYTCIMSGGCNWRAHGRATVSRPWTHYSDMSF